MQTSRSLHVDAVVYREGEEFVAHALQLDLVVTAKSVEQAMEDLGDVCAAQIQHAFENNNFEYLLRPAPAEVWEKFWEANDSG